MERLTAGLKYFRYTAYSAGKVGMAIRNQILCVMVRCFNVVTKTVKKLTKKNISHLFTKRAKVIANAEVMKKRR